MKKLNWLFCLFALISFSSNATLILNTGEATEGENGISFFTQSDSYQSVAAYFTLTDSWNINSLEAWFAGTAKGQNATASVYTVDENQYGVVPGTRLYSSKFSFENDLFLLNGPSGAWEGAKGLNWLLDSGDYYMVFEYDEGQIASGYLPHGAEGSVEHTAYDNSNLWRERTGPITNEWGQVISNTNIGVRIDATSVQVPEPSTYLLFLLAALGLTTRQRKVSKL